MYLNVHIKILHRFNGVRSSAKNYERHLRRDLSHNSDSGILKQVQNDVFGIKYLYLCMVFSLIIFFGCKESTTEAQDDPDKIPDLPGWTLVWNDEFNGTQVATTRWNFEVNGWGGGNNELQYYTDRLENAYAQDGYLHIVALEEAIPVRMVQRVIHRRVSRPKIRATGSMAALMSGPNCLTARDYGRRSG